MANNYMLNDQFPKAIKNATSTSDGLMSSEDKAKFDSVFDDLGVLTPATIDKDGLMSKEDKKKLDELEKTNSYIHPATHPATMIVQDSIHRFVSDEDINQWNIKASNALATQTTNGLMSSSDKLKLDNLNKYIDKKTVFNLNELIEDREWGNANNALGYAVDPFINYLNSNSIQLENGMCILIKTSDKIPINTDGLVRNIWQEWIILDKDNYKKKAAWDQLIYRDATQVISGLMSAIDKKKLDQLINYTHPDTHPASMITTDTNNRFVTDVQITAWNTKATAALATQTTNGLMSSLDKIKLDNIITTVATTTSNGLMSSADKINLETLLTKIATIEQQQADIIAKLQTAVFIEEE